MNMRKMHTALLMLLVVLLSLSAPSVKAEEPEWCENSGTYGVHSERNGIDHYVTDTGMTSVAVQGQQIVWLKYESQDSSTWYGLDNSGSILENGSRFFVQWLNLREDQDKWNALYARLDEEQKEVWAGSEWMFVVGVCGTDGVTPCEGIGDIPLYIQSGEDWNRKDITAYASLFAGDEVPSITMIQQVPPREKEGTFWILPLKYTAASLAANHDSGSNQPDDKDGSSDVLPVDGDEGDVSAPPRTGDEFNVILWYALAFISLLGMAMLACKRKEA